MACYQKDNAIELHVEDSTSGPGSTAWSLRWAHQTLPRSARFSHQ